MRDQFLIASAAVALLAFPAAAQVAGPASPATGSPAVGATAGAAGQAATQATTPPPVNPMPGDPAPTVSTPRSASPSSSLGAAAETGVAANTSATESDLKAGAAVRDAAGVEVGTISKVTKGKAGAGSMVTLSSGGKTVTVPAASLSVSEGALVSAQTKAELWAPK